MMLFYGTRWCGKVDRVPGLCYVRTRFFHLQFVPLIPLASYLLIEGTNEERGVPIPLSIKSILTAWIRTALVGIAVGYAVAAVVHVFMLLTKHEASMVRLLESVGWMGGACLVYWMTVCFSRAGYRRAIKLGRYLGLEPAIVERYLYGPAALDGSAASEAVAPAEEPSKAADGPS